MTLGLHRRILIENIKSLKEKLPNHPTGFWEYKVKLTEHAYRRFRVPSNLGRFSKKVRS